MAIKLHFALKLWRALKILTVLNSSLCFLFFFFPRRIKCSNFFFPHKYYVGVERERKFPTVPCRQSRPLPGWFSPIMKDPGSPRNVNFYFKCQASYKQASKSHFPAPCHCPLVGWFLEGQFLGTLWYLLPLYLFWSFAKFSHTVTLSTLFCGYWNCCSQRLSKLPRPRSRWVSDLGGVPGLLSASAGITPSIASRGCKLACFFPLYLIRIWYFNSHFWVEVNGISAP